MKAQVQTWQAGSAAWKREREKDTHTVLVTVMIVSRHPFDQKGRSEDLILPHIHLMELIIHATPHGPLVARSLQDQSLLRACPSGVVNLLFPPRVLVLMRG